MSPQRPMMVRGLVLAVLLAGVAGIAAADCGGWQWANPTPQGNDLRAVAFGNGVYVAVGDYGALQRSADGAHWATPPRLTDQNLHDIAWTALGFIAVGDRGTVLMSDTGADWWVEDVGTFQDLRTVVSDGVEVLLHAEDTPVVTTLDAEIWEVTEVEFIEPVAMAWGFGQYVAVTPHEILISGSGTSWTEVGSSENEAFLDVIVTDTGYAVVGEGGLMWRGSSDGLDWTPEDTGTSRDLHAIHADGDFLVAVGRSGIVVTSFEGGAWERWDSPTNLNLLALAHSDEVGYVAVGASGVAATSPYGREWTGHSNYFPRDDLVEVAWTGQRFVALSGPSLAKAGSDLYWTDTGTDWQEATLAGNWQLLAMTCGATSCVAVGEDRAAVTADGLEWEAVSVPEVDLASVAWHGGMYVAIGLRFGDGAVLNSPDGYQWTDVSPAGAPVLRDVAASPTIWVAVGDQGTIYVSHSGSHWTPREIDTTKSFTAVAWTGTRFVAVGERSLIAHSEDGELWTVQTSPKDRGPGKAGVTRFLDVARVGDGVLAVGEEGTMLSSTDGGLSWSWRDFPTLNALEGIAWNGEQELIVGQGGLTVRRLCPPRVRRGGDRRGGP